MTIQDGWFYEGQTLWQGQKFAVKVEKVVFEKRSAFQDILIFKSETYGMVLVLDDVIQLTERDEFAYQEMMTHVPLFSHPKPRRVLIIGGGDGGVLREVCRHSTVEHVTMCDLDSMVCNASKQYFPTVACSFDDPRVTLLHEDGAKLMEHTDEHWDVIIVDSTDPVGPAEALFEASFYAKAASALEPSNGILCIQGECIWLHLKIISKIMETIGQNFSSVDYGYCTIPSYPSGQIGFVVASHNGKTVFRSPRRTPTENTVQKLRYYSTEMHSCCFVLPQFAEKVIGKWRKQIDLTCWDRSSVVALCVAAAGIVFGVGLSRR